MFTLLYVLISRDILLSNTKSYCFCITSFESKVNLNIILLPYIYNEIHAIKLN